MRAFRRIGSEQQRILSLKHFSAKHRIDREGREPGKLYPLFTAQTFLALLERYGTLTQGMRLVCYCLSEAVAKVLAPLGFDVRVAAGKREEDVLALLNSEAASS